MPGPRSREVKVLKSSRRADTYVFLPIEHEYADLPETFKASFGEATFVVDFLLEPNKELAQADAQAVLSSIDEQGFYVQLPPPRYVAVEPDD